MATRVYQIPTPGPDEPFISQKTVLSGSVYIIEMRYNTRREIWELSLATEDGTSIVRCVTMAPNWDALLGVSDANRPPGGIILVTGSGDYPTLSSLQTDGLYYVVDEEDDG